METSITTTSIRVPAGDVEIDKSAFTLDGEEEEEEEEEVNTSFLSSSSFGTEPIDFCVQKDDSKKEEEACLKTTETNENVAVTESKNKMNGHAMTKTTSILLNDVTTVVWAPLYNAAATATRFTSSSASSCEATKTKNLEKPVVRDDRVQEEETGHLDNDHENAYVNDDIEIATTTTDGDNDNKSVEVEFNDTSETDVVLMASDRGVWGMGHRSRSRSNSGAEDADDDNFEGDTSTIDDDDDDCDNDKQEEEEDDNHIQEEKEREEGDETEVAGNRATTTRTGSDDQEKKEAGVSHGYAWTKRLMLSVSATASSAKRTTSEEESTTSTTPTTISSSSVSSPFSLFHAFSAETPRAKTQQQQQQQQQQQHDEENVAAKEDNSSLEAKPNKCNEITTTAAKETDEKATVPSSYSMSSLWNPLSLMTNHTSSAASRDIKVSKKVNEEEMEKENQQDDGSKLEHSRDDANDDSQNSTAPIAFDEAIEKETTATNDKDKDSTKALMDRVLGSFESTKTSAAILSFFSPSKYNKNERNVHDEKHEESMEEQAHGDDRNQQTEKNAEQEQQGGNIQVVGEQEQQKSGSFSMAGFSSAAATLASSSSIPWRMMKDMSKRYGSTKQETTTNLVDQETLKAINDNGNQKPENSNKNDNTTPTEDVANEDAQSKSSINISWMMMKGLSNTYNNMISMGSSSSQAATTTTTDIDSGSNNDRDQCQSPIDVGFGDVEEEKKEPTDEETPTTQVPRSETHEEVLNSDQSSSIIAA